MHTIGCSKSACILLARLTTSIVRRSDSEIPLLLPAMLRFDWPWLSFFHFDMSTECFFLIFVDDALETRDSLSTARGPSAPSLSRGFGRVSAWSFRSLSRIQPEVCVVCNFPLSDLVPLVAADVGLTGGV